MKMFKRMLSVVTATIMLVICVSNNITSVFSENASTYTRKVSKYGLPDPVYYSNPHENEEIFDNNTERNRLTNSNNLKTKGNVGTSCDLSQSLYFPQIGCQRGGSCTLWSTAYYQFTYEANKLNNIRTSLNNSYSPVFMYSFLNSAYNYEAYDFLKEHGCVKLKDWGLYESDDEWCTNTDAMIKALGTRISDYHKISIITDKASDKINRIKELLYGTNGTDGKIVAVDTLNFDGWNYRKVKEPAQYANQLVAVHSVNTKDFDGHAITIVGYNDNIWCDINNNKRKDKGEVGAFKIANSHGSAYGNSGYAWVLYDALNKQSMLSGWESKPEDRVPIFSYSDANYNNFYYINVENKKVNLVGQLFVGTSFRNTLKVYAGTNNINKTPSNYKTVFTFENESKPGMYDGTLVFDYSDLININFSSNLKKYLFLKFYGKRDIARFKITDNMSTTIANLWRPTVDLDFKLDGEVSTEVNLYIGDLNYDKQINALDVSILIEYVEQKKELSDLQLFLGDVNKDGKINTSDVEKLSRNIMKNSSTSLSDIRTINSLNKEFKTFMLANKNNYSKEEIDMIDYICNFGDDIQMKLEDVK